MVQMLSRKLEIKVKKYQDIARSLRGTNKDVSVDVVVVGALGSWDPTNDRICHRLCSKKYTKLMKKLIVADMVRHSRDIYVQHVSKIPQVQPPRYTRFFNVIADQALASVVADSSVAAVPSPVLAALLPVPSASPVRDVHIRSCNSQLASPNQLNFEIQMDIPGSTNPSQAAFSSEGDSDLNPPSLQSDSRNQFSERSAPSIAIGLTRSSCHSNGQPVPECF